MGGDDARVGSIQGRNVPRIYVDSLGSGSYSLQTASGALDLQAAQTALGYPDSMIVHPRHPVLYTMDAPDLNVNWFTVDPMTGALSKKGTVKAAGDAGRHELSLHPSGRWLFAVGGDADDLSPALSVLPVADDGSLGPPVDSYFAKDDIRGVITDVGGHHVFLDELGLNRFAFDPATGHLGPPTMVTLSLPKAVALGALAFHPSGKFAYIATSDYARPDNGGVTLFAYDVGRGTFSSPQRMSFVWPTDSSYRGDSIVISPGGDFMAVLTRPAGDRGGIYGRRLDPQTGRVLENTVGSGAPMFGAPLDMILEPETDTLVVLHSALNDASILSAFRVDRMRGLLTTLGAPVGLETRAQHMALLPASR